MAAFGRHPREGAAAFGRCARFWLSVCQEGWNSYGQVKLQRISERLKISLSLPRFGWFYKRNGTTWSDGRVGPKNGVPLEILQYPGHDGNWQ